MKHGTAEYSRWSFLIAAVVIFSLIPVLWIMSLSFKTAATVGDGRVIPKDWTLDNYSALFKGGFDSPLLRPLINSILIALIATTIAVAIASLAAYAIARLNFPGKFLVLGGALAVSMVPPISAVRALFDMWRALGLSDTYPGLIIPYLTFALPLAIDILVALFREIPWDLEEAAQVDCATAFQAC